MEIRLITPDDFDFIRSVDPHATASALNRRLSLSTCYLLFEGGIPIGLFHYTFFWDSIPFLNLLYILPAFQKRGYGKAAMDFWETEMKRQGFPMVLISTQVDEDAQHFYRKIGYADCGGLLLSGSPLSQPMEMFMRKCL